MMELAGEEVIEDAIRRFPDTRRWLNAWIESVRRAEWQSIIDVRVEYPSADGVKLRSGLVVTVFNVRGNSYRLLSDISYVRQVVYALEVLTHAEYDKQSWKKRY
jgi:mRNA interferase HigB